MQEAWEASRSAPPSTPCTHPVPVTRSHDVAATPDHCARGLGRPPFLLSSNTITTPDRRSFLTRDSLCNAAGVVQIDSRANHEPPSRSTHTAAANHGCIRCRSGHRGNHRRDRSSCDRAENYSIAVAVATTVTAPSISLSWLSRAAARRPRPSDSHSVLLLCSRFPLPPPSARRCLHPPGHCQ